MISIIKHEIKLEYYKNTNKESKIMDLDLKIKTSKYMTNASFYRLKYKTINIVANYWFGGLTDVIDNIRI